MTTLYFLRLTLVAHNWIRDKLHQCIRKGYHWRRSAIIVGEEEIISRMMEISDQRSSFNDIWTVTVEDVSVFYYNTTLATWFFGLNLVRFEHKPKRGRSLEII